jgi:osmotically-inducible protein OsmY
MNRFRLKTIALFTVAAALGFPGGPLRAMETPALPMEQASSAGNSGTDVDLAAKIRRAVVHDKTLSIAAHNVDVVVKDGIMTIHGQVPSSDRGDAILQKPRDLAGAENVVDAMAITPPKSS